MAGFPAASVDVVVTSPPYNLGIRYRSYADQLPRERYLHWTSAWIGSVARWLRPAGSLFLNVGARPTDPWTAIDIAQAARPHLHLQNTLHWISPSPSTATLRAPARGWSAIWRSDITNRSTARDS